MPRFSNRGSYDPRFLPPAGTGYFGAAISPALANYQREIALLSDYVPDRVTENPDYYQNLLARGHTVDPYTGHDIPQKEIDKFAGTKKSKSATTTAATDVGSSTVAPARGPAIIYNPYAAPTSAPLTAEGIAAAQEKNRRRQSTLPFSEVQQQFQELLIGSNAAPSPLTSEGATAKFAAQSQEQREMANAIRPHFAARDKQAAADAIAILKAASEPGVFGSDIANMKQQFAAKYPEHEALLESMSRPMSRQQIQELEDAQTLEQFRDGAEKVGLPRDFYHAIKRDKDGNVEPVSQFSPDQWLRFQTDNRKQEVEVGRNERDFWKDELREHRKTERPEIPTFQDLGLLGSEEEKMAAVQSVEALQRAWDDRQDELQIKAFGFSPTAAARAANPVPEQTPPHEQALAKGVQFFRPETVEQIGTGIQSGGWQAGAIVEWEGASYELVKTKDGGLKLFPLQ